MFLKFFYNTFRFLKFLFYQIKFKFYKLENDNLTIKKETIWKLNNIKKNISHLLLKSQLQSLMKNNNSYRINNTKTIFVMSKRTTTNYNNLILNNNAM